MAAMAQIRGVKTPFTKAVVTRPSTSRPSRGGSRSSRRGR